MGPRAFALILSSCLLACGGKASAPPAQPAEDPLMTSTGPELFDQGRTLVGRGDYIRAEQYLAAALERGQSPADVIPVLLDACIRGRRYQSALSYAGGQLRRDPDDWRLRYVVATLHQALGERTKARSELERVVVGDPDFADAHYALGALLWTSGDRERANVHLQRYLELEPAGAHAAEAKEQVARLESGIQKSASGGTEPPAPKESDTAGKGGAP